MWLTFEFLEWFAAADEAGIDGFDHHPFMKRLADYRSRHVSAYLAAPETEKDLAAVVRFRRQVIEKDVCVNQTARSRREMVNIHNIPRLR
jgi:hypothetical protein